MWVIEYWCHNPVFARPTADGAGGNPSMAALAQEAQTVS